MDIKKIRRILKNNKVKKGLGLLATIFFQVGHFDGFFQSSCALKRVITYVMPGKQ